MNHQLYVKVSLGLPPITVGALVNTLAFMAKDQAVRDDAIPQQLYLKDWRIARGWTQQQLADLMDTDKGTISRLEGQKQRVTDHWLNRYSRTFGLPTIRFYTHPSRPSIDAMLIDVPADVRDLIEASVVSMIERHKRR